MAMAPIPNLKGVKIGNTPPTSSTGTSPNNPSTPTEVPQNVSKLDIVSLLRKYKTVLIVGVLVLGVGFVVSKIVQSNQKSKVKTIVASANGMAIGARTKKDACRPVDGLPDNACTPGATLASGTVSRICKSGYASDTRSVSSSTKNQTYASYDIETRKAGEYEIDHLIPLKLGGGNTIANLWPEAASPSPGWKEKDKVEDYLYTHVCNGTISLESAQNAIATNWRAIYEKIK